ncbi:UNVERIFIED_CONTAM: hypothetical protein GTU68_048575 [Idotea baltica]|nr:hypothetical protein [Idotea baltica]
MIWKQAPTPELLNQAHKNTLISHLGIKIVEVGPDFISATMPVDHRTVQPMGLLHGGASVVLAESLGSLAAMLTIGDTDSEAVVGAEINASHLATATSGLVVGTVKPIKIGRRLQFWNIEIKQGNKMICISRHTTMKISKS